MVTYLSPSAWHRQQAIGVSFSPFTVYTGLDVTPVRSLGSKLGVPNLALTQDVAKLFGGTQFAECFS